MSYEGGLMEQGKPDVAMLESFHAKAAHKPCETDVFSVHGVTINTCAFLEALEALKQNTGLFFPASGE
jgi:hypothetical protein